MRLEELNVYLPAIWWIAPDVETHGGASLQMETNIINDARSI